MSRTDYVYKSLLLLSQKLEIKYYNSTNCMCRYKHHIKPYYYMASLRVGKMKQTQRCDWLPERARWDILPGRYYPLFLAR